MSKLNGWRVGLEYSVSKQGDYARDMAKQMREDPNYKKREATTDQTENYYASLEREMRGEKRDWVAPFEVNPVAVPYANDLTDLVGERRFTMEETMIVESIRRAEKNTFGQSHDEGSSRDRKERAAHHYNVTPGVKSEDIQDPTRIRGLVEIASQRPQLELKRKYGKLQNIRGWSLWEAINFTKWWK